MQEVYKAMQEVARPLTEAMHLSTILMSVFLFWVWKTQNCKDYMFENTKV